MSLFSDDTLSFDRRPEGYILGNDHPEFHMRKRIPVAVLGATGTVGQRMIEILSEHPWFEIVQLGASLQSKGKRYKDAVHWLLPSSIPSSVADMQVEECAPRKGIALAFSALDSSVAEEVEKLYSNAGVHVVTNAKSHRMKDWVPLVIPEVNVDHLQIVDKAIAEGKGAIVANPNCATIGLCVALKPLVEQFGVDKIHVTTFQSTSGAGFPGVASLSILDNVIPFIDGEEDKVETEPLKIFSDLKDGVFHAPEMKISASCTRVPVTEGHLESVSVSLKKKVSIDEVERAFHEFTSPLSEMKLPMSPKRPIHFFHERSYPQPKLHRMSEKGMAVSVGALRPCSLFDYKFFLLSHNTIRGAAGGTVQIAELLVKKAKVFW